MSNDAGTGDAARPCRPRHAAGEVHRLDFHGVYLLAEGEAGLVAVPELHLSLDEGGVKAVHPDGSAALEESWDRILELSVPAHATTPAGGSALEMSVRTVSGPSHRLVVPTGEPSVLEGRIASLASRQGVAPDSPDRPPPIVLVCAVVLAVGAVVAVLLLSAGHVIHL